MLIPSLLQMLTIAEGMDITNTELAWDNYTRHYDLFFDITSHAIQEHALVEEMATLGILLPSEDPNFKYIFNDNLDVKQALLVVNASKQNSST